MRFKKTEEVAAATVRLFALLTTMGKWRGDILPWSKIDDTLGVSHLTNEGQHIVDCFRTELRRDHKIVTDVEVSVGVHLLTHREAAELVPYKRQKKAYRQMGRALRETDTIDGGELPDRLRSGLSMQRHNLRRQRLQLGRSYREHAEQITKTVINPRRKRPAETGKDK